MMASPGTRSRRLNAGWLTAHSPAPWVWALALIAAYVVGVLPSLGQTLVETHAHRQTQTAYTALLYARDGIDLFSVPLPILGAPGNLPQEFPLFQAMGALIIRAGIQPDTAMRLVGLASFTFCAWFLWLFARRIVGAPGGLVALAAFLFNPIAWVYGRASLMEYLAVGAAIAYLYFGTLWLERGRKLDLGWALLGGWVGILVKITTGGFYLLPLLLWRDSRGELGYRRWSVWFLIISSCVVGLAWSTYAQAVRQETPAAEFLSMSNQLGWFFGQLTTRFDPQAWRVPLVALIALTGFGFVAWAWMAIREARAASQSKFVLGLLSLVVVMPLVLFNLYAVHDYYWVATTPVIALAVGLGGRRLMRRWHAKGASRLALVMLTAWIATVAGTFGSWSIIYGTPGEQAKVMRIASFVADHSGPSDWVVLRGWGWNSTFLYYGRRRGIAVPEANVTGSGVVGGQDLSGLDLDGILADPIYGPQIYCDHEANCVVESTR